jgi:hypothetical protein
MIKNLEELLTSIFTDIRKYNSNRTMQAVPQSDWFFEEIQDRYSLIPFTIPKLVKILTDSHKIFTFKIVEADGKERIRRVDGMVTTEGNIIKTLLGMYGDELVRAYSHEFSKKFSVERIIKEFFPKLDVYNNTHIGKVANIVIHLMSFESILERNIAQYNIKWQEKQLKAELEKSDLLSSFIDGGTAVSNSEGGDSGRASSDILRRAIDLPKYEEFKRYMSKNSIEKTLIVYGVEFYSRVCFREYQFNLVQKLIEDGHISDASDLLLAKKMLQKTRANSDQDLNLQKYAHDINDLERIINDKIKKGSGR